MGKTNKELTKYYEGSVPFSRIGIKTSSLNTHWHNWRLDTGNTYNWKVIKKSLTGIEQILHEISNCASYIIYPGKKNKDIQILILLFRLPYCIEVILQSVFIILHLIVRNRFDSPTI